MFSRVYWNQPVRPCVCLCTKYWFLSKRWLGYKTIKSDLVTALVIITIAINSRSSSIWLFVIKQKVRYAIINQQLQNKVKASDHIRSINIVSTANAIHSKNRPLLLFQDSN